MNAFQDNATGVGVNHGTINISSNGSPISTFPSNIALVVRHLSEVSRLDDVDSPEKLPYDISDKINFNSLIKNRWLIEEYGEYAFSVEKVYSEISSIKPGFKKQVLRFLKVKYNEIKGSVLLENMTNGEIDVINIIRKNSDFIIDSIFNEILRITLGSNNIGETNYDDIHLAIYSVIGHASVECKILERPIT